MISSKVEIPLSRVRVQRGEEIIVEEEVVYLDLCLWESQKGTDPTDLSSVREWLPKFRDAIRKDYDCDISDTEAHMLASQTVSIIESLKKNLSDTQKSLPSTELIPQNSIQKNSSDCLQTSLEFAQDENLIDAET
jgi:hypothetical protein